jgi:hypothetical protein
VREREPEEGISERHYILKGGGTENCISLRLGSEDIKGLGEKLSKILSKI